MIRLFADTANLDEISYSFSRGVNDGITTNPKIMESTGDLSEGFEEACRVILEHYPNVPVSLETDLRGIKISEIEERYREVRSTLLDQADSLMKLGRNVVVKIPICYGGLEATTLLSGSGIKTNVTACMTPYQAIEASRHGATYVSLFANRMLDSKILTLSGISIDLINSGSDWKETVKKNKEKYFENAWKEVVAEIAYVANELDDSNSKLIVGSIRAPEDIYRIAEASPQVITIPTGIVKGLEKIDELKKTERKKFDFSGVNLGNSISHPMTDYTLEEFERAADSYR